MMAAHRLRGFGWLALVFAAVLGCYLVSLQVAVERKRLNDVNARILATKHDLRQLSTEFATRGSLRQLERWNGETLALSAPQEAQFLKGEVQLARFDAGALPEASGASPTMLALVSAAAPSATVASDGATVATQPIVQAVVAAAAAQATPRPNATAVPTTAVAQRTVRQAVSPTIRPAAAPVRTAAAPPRAAPLTAAAPIPVRAARRDPVIERMASADRRRAERVAMLDAKLLGDLVREARVESGGGAR